MKKTIYWLPRVLSIIIVAFLALFILEGIGPDFGWQDSLSHLALALVGAGVSAVAWKWPKIGGWVFLAAGLWYVKEVFTGEHWSLLIIGGVPCLTGILFLIDGFSKKKIQ
jgi:hypothetical protein